MKNLFALAFIAIFSAASYGQGLELGLKVGANYANLTDISGADGRAGLHFGAFAGIKFNSKFALQSELLYSQQGAKLDIDEINLDYINLPVFAKIYLVRGLNIQGGPQFGFVVDDNLSDFNLDNDDINKVDVSGFIGLGYDLPFGLRFDGRYHFGATEVFKNGDSKHSMFSLALGYSFL